MSRTAAECGLTRVACLRFFLFFFSRRRFTKLQSIPSGKLGLEYNPAAGSLLTRNSVIFLMVLELSGFHLEVVILPGESIYFVSDQCRVVYQGFPSHFAQM